jgi:hypothetical protein
VRFVERRAMTWEAQQTWKWAGSPLSMSITIRAAFCPISSSAGRTLLSPWSRSATLSSKPITPMSRPGSSPRSRARSIAPIATASL